MHKNINQFIDKFLNKNNLSTVVTKGDVPTSQRTVQKILNKEDH